jgi:hypothetical protein
MLYSPSGELIDRGKKTTIQQGIIAMKQSHTKQNIILFL